MMELLRCGIIELCSLLYLKKRDYMAEKINNSTNECMELSRLPVFRNSHCSQEMADNIVNILQTDFYENLFELYESVFEPEYLHNLNDIIEITKTEVSKKTDIPSTRLGRLDLAFEIHRRILCAHQIEDPKVPGKDLIPDQLPPLLKCPVSDVIFDAIPQAFADRAMFQLYSKRPDLLCEIADNSRYRLYSREVYQEFLAFVSENLSQADIQSVAAIKTWKLTLFGEVSRCARKMSGAPSI